MASEIVMEHAFTLYSHDVAKLEAFIREAKRYASLHGDKVSLSFDTDSDGNVKVHAAGMEALNL